MSVLVRNERRKLLASYINSIASAVMVGGSLPVLLALSQGGSVGSSALVTLMIGSFMLSPTLHAIALLPLNRLEEAE